MSHVLFQWNSRLPNQAANMQTTITQNATSSSQSEKLCSNSARAAKNFCGRLRNCISSPLYELMGHRKNMMTPGTNNPHDQRIWRRLSRLASEYTSTTNPVMPNAMRCVKYPHVASASTVTQRTV